MKRVLIEASTVMLGLFLFAVTLGETNRLKKSAIEKDLQIEKLSKAISLKFKAKPERDQRSLEERMDSLQEAWESLKADFNKTKISKSIDNLVKESTFQMLGNFKNTKHFFSENKKELLELKKDIAKQKKENKNLLDRLIMENRPKDEMIKKMLSPTVQISGEENVGSGTVIYSSNSPNTNKGTYILTAYHVIRNINSENPREKNHRYTITTFGLDGKRREHVSVLVGYKKSLDVALLKLVGNEIIDEVAGLSDLKDLEDIKIWTNVFAIGCPLGNDPIPTGGFVASQNSKLGKVNYWMINAPTYFGNSGGGVYSAKTLKLIGVFSKIYTHGKIRPVVISHMGLIVPLAPIYKWFRKTGNDFLIPH